MTDRNLYLAAYDIVNSRRLRAVLKLLKGHATGGQKSVYECFLTSAEHHRLLDDVGEAIDSKEDRFLMIRLDPRSRVHTLGIAVEPKDPPFFYHG
ncbi:CRISPR-associated protein Cas2 [mine drainage metagenome]|uniref:CRISPR-associated protein Cas2 n=1 Tax=mine drainage metagenome TaxID=410659 RepID=T1D662_9ZZZZ